jgi:hypothetical protein
MTYQKEEPSLFSPKKDEPSSFLDIHLKEERPQKEPAPLQKSSWLFPFFLGFLFFGLILGVLSGIWLIYGYFKV